jgi:hypothetical protein
MRHSNLRSNHRETAVFTETRLALDTAFLPERLVLPPTTSSIEELLELAESYARDADRIRAESSQALARIQELEALVAKLQAERASLQVHLRAKTRTDQRSLSTEPDQLSTLPFAGEVRFYKKHYSAPSHDVVVRVPDCGCNRWQGAHAGHKAREGIAKLEGNRMNWKTLHHCASCTGGGMWRVRW